MIDLNTLQSELTEDMDAVKIWQNTVYQEHFEKYFQSPRDMFRRLKSKASPITDDELSWILIDLPLHLFDASEALNQFQLYQEVVKLHTKRKESDAFQNSNAKTISNKKEEATITVLEDKLLIKAYESIITRVNEEISFCRELIMGAKKIWDARRKSEEANPVSPQDIPKSELPDYTIKQYVKGS